MGKLHVAIALVTTGATGAAGYGALSFFEPRGGGSSEAVALTVTEQPGYPIDIFEAPLSGGPVIRAIGIYEGGSRHDFNHSPRETVRIEVAEQHGQPLYLALSSYEPVLWTLSGAGLVDVRGVYLAGYNRHEVSGVSQAIVTNRSGREQMRQDQERARQLEEGGWGKQAIPESVSCTITFAAPDGGGCDSAGSLLRNAQNQFKAPIGSFFGVYNAQGFRIAERRDLKQPSEQSYSNPWLIEKDH